MATATPRTPRCPPPAHTLQDDTLRLRRRLFQLEQFRSRQLSDYVFAHIAIAFDLDIEIVKKIFDAGRGAFLRHKQKFCEGRVILNFTEPCAGRSPTYDNASLQDRRRMGGSGRWQRRGDFVGGRVFCLKHRGNRRVLLEEKEETFHINGLTYQVTRDRHREWRINHWKCAAKGYYDYSPEAQQNAREMLRELEMDGTPDFVLKIVNEKKRDMVKHPIFQALGKGTIKQLQVKNYLLKDDEFQ